MVQKDGFLKSMKNENGTQHLFFINVWHWDPLKSVPGAVLNKYEKSINKQSEKTMACDGPKPLKRIEQQKRIRSFEKSIKKQCQKGSLN